MCKFVLFINKENTDGGQVLLVQLDSSLHRITDDNSIKTYKCQKAENIAHTELDWGQI